MHHLIETNRFYNQGVRSHQARKIISIPLLCCGSKRLMSCKSSQRPFIFSESRWRRTVIAVAANSMMPALTCTTLGWSSLCTNQRWHAKAATNCNIYAASWLFFFFGGGGLCMYKMSELLLYFSSTVNQVALTPYIKLHRHQIPTVLDYYWNTRRDIKLCPGIHGINSLMLCDTAMLTVFNLQRNPIKTNIQHLAGLQSANTCEQSYRNYSRDRQRNGKAKH